MAEAEGSARWRFRLLRAAAFKLDGGSMFGLIPRVVWSRHVATDDKGRIAVQHNCLLLERAGDGGTGTEVAGSPRRVLIEAGSGDKLDAKMREIFALEVNPVTGRSRTVADALAEAGVSPEQIDAAVVSHLHFDHAGGLTRTPRAGEAPEFAFAGDADGGGGSSAHGGCCLTLPNAAVYVQAREWADAVANRSVMTRTYFADHLTPLRDAGRIRLVDSPRPFASGSIVDRDGEPMGDVEARMTELWTGAGIFAFLVPGHTWGQQAILFREPDRADGRAGRTIVFTPDVMPTVQHVGAAYSLAYDVEPYTSMVTRGWFLRAAMERGWVLCLDHEPGHPLVRVKANGRGWYELVAEPAEST